MKKTKKKKVSKPNSKKINIKLIVIVLLVVIALGTIAFFLFKNNKLGNHKNFENGINTLVDEAKETLSFSDLLSFAIDTTQSMGIEVTASSEITDKETLKMSSSINVGLDYKRKSVSLNYDAIRNDTPIKFDAVYEKNALYLLVDNLSAPYKIVELDEFEIPELNLKDLDKSIDNISKAFIGGTRKVKVTEIESNNNITSTLVLNKENSKVFMKTFVNQIKKDENLINLISLMNQTTKEETNNALDELVNEKFDLKFEVLTKDKKFSGLNVYKDNEKVVELAYGDTTNVTITQEKNVTSITKTNNVIDYALRNNNKRVKEIKVTLGKDSIEYIDKLDGNKKYNINYSITGDIAKVGFSEESSAGIITADFILTKNITVVKQDVSNAKNVDDLTEEDTAILKELFEAVLGF